MLRHADQLRRLRGTVRIIRGFWHDHDAEIRELLAANSFIIRSVNPENLSKLRRLFHPQAVELAENLQMFDFRLEQVIWKGARPYSLLLRFAVVILLRPTEKPSVCYC